jgi:hypothetical protein
VTGEEAIGLLKRGDVRAWNAWREDNPDILPNLLAAWNAWRKDNPEIIFPSLRHANLSRADLSGADLSEVDLTGASLIDAKLHETSLYNADLLRAKLHDAKLQDANLSDADLFGADLSGADLSRAKLTFANLGGADLSRANLTDVYLYETSLVNVDLTEARGLETCIHAGPSAIDHRTLQKSGSLPTPFLRGIGLPDDFIGYLPSLFTQAIKYYSCFISYSGKDETFANQIYADLQKSGVRCWFAPHDLPIGEEIRGRIDAAIKLRDKVVLILSEHSIRSGWVKDEVETAFEEEQKRPHTVLSPVRLDDAVLTTAEAWAAKLRRQRHIGDFRRWKDNDAYKQSFERVLRNLKHPTKVAQANPS